MDLSWQDSIELEIADFRDGKGRLMALDYDVAEVVEDTKERRRLTVKHKKTKTKLKIDKDYMLGRSGKWTENDWLTRSSRFDESGKVPKWFADSTDSDIGSLNMYEIGAKVCVCGDAAVGKTSFTQRYISKRFHRTYKWTVGVDFALKVVKWSDNISIKLQLWDIAGQERFTSMTRVYYKDAHACIIMFDLNQRATFENALKWKKDLDTKCRLSDGSPVPCILLANKCDLPYREVEQTEIEDFCKEQNFIGWTETSVLQGLMIEEPMQFLLDEMMARREEIVEDSNTHRELGGLDPANSSIKLQRKNPPQKASKCNC